MSETVFIKVKNYGPLEVGTTDLEGGFLKVPRGNCKTRKLPQNMNLYTIS